MIPLNVPNFPSSCSSASSAWNAFAAGLQMARARSRRTASLVLRPGFPTALLPVVALLVVFVDYLVALPILLVALLPDDRGPATALLLPVLILIQLLLIAGSGSCSRRCSSSSRTCASFVAIVVALGFWLTPVCYRQRPRPGSVRAALKLNPMAHLIEAQRQILLEGELPSAACASARGAPALASSGRVRRLRRDPHSLPERI